MQSGSVATNIEQAKFASSELETPPRFAEAKATAAAMKKQYNVMDLYKEQFFQKILHMNINIYIYICVCVCVICI